MEIIEASRESYNEVIGKPYFIYGAADFNHLNRGKCEKDFYLLFKERKFRLGIIGGLRNGIFQSPISAPFGGFTFISEDVKLQYVEEAIKLLNQWAVNQGIKTIKLVLPPSIYCESFMTKQLNSLWRADFNILDIDLNFYFSLDKFNTGYKESLWYNALKNLRIAFENDLQFHQCISEKDRAIAYEIIKKNREARNFPLKLSWEQIRNTIQLIEADFFLVYTKLETFIASAIVFHINHDIVQVIYWGDLPGYSEIKPMNFLSFKVFEHYKNNGKKIVDVGPSSEFSIPNYGLCEFKESLGCTIDAKYTLTNNLE